MPRPIRNPHVRPHHYGLDGVVNHFAANHASNIRRGRERLASAADHARRRFEGHPDLERLAMQLVERRVQQ